MAQKYNHNVRHLHQFPTLLQFNLTSPYGEYSTVQSGDKKLLFFPCLCLTSPPALSIDRPSCVLATSNGFHMTTGLAHTRAQALTNLTTISL